MNFKEIITDNDTPIVLIDGTKESLDLLAQVREVRDNCPCIVFDEYFKPKHRALGGQSFSFKPVEMTSDGVFVWSTYQTNICRLIIEQDYEDEYFSKILEFEAEPQLVPSWLWTKTFAPKAMNIEYFNGDIWLVP